MKNKLITLLITGPLISSSFLSIASEVPAKEYFNKRCMDAWQSIKAGDREALFAELPPKLQNWNEGKTAWKQVDKAIKDYKEDWDETKLASLAITQVQNHGDGSYNSSGLQDSVRNRRAKLYPEATREYILHYEFNVGSYISERSCIFLELDNQWYMYHNFI